MLCSLLSLSSSRPCIPHGTSSQVHTGDQKQDTWILWVLVTGQCSLVCVVLSCLSASSAMALKQCLVQRGAAFLKTQSWFLFMEEAPTLHVTENAQSFFIEKRN